MTSFGGRIGGGGPVGLRLGSMKMEWAGGVKLVTCRPQIYQGSSPYGTSQPGPLPQLVLIQTCIRPINCIPSCSTTVPVVSCEAPGASPSMIRDQMADISSFFLDHL